MDKKSYKSRQSALRKKMRDKGYKSISEKSYFDYSTRERANIRANAKQGSAAHKWATNGATGKPNPFKSNL